MNTARVASITEMLLRKTEANGCTPGEAAAAAARVALYIRHYGIKVLAKPPVAPPPPCPPQTPSEAEYDAWRAQFGTTPYRCILRKRRLPRIKSGPWVGFVVGGFWIAVLVCVAFGV